MADTPPQPGCPPRPPAFSEVLRFWLKLGLISFGGPSGQISIMHTELVERRRWISEARFLHALNFCMLLPGPEAQQLATYCGWMLHRTWGGIAAGALFVLPSAVLLWLLSWGYLAYENLPLAAHVFEGLKPAVLAIVVGALLKIGQKALKGSAAWMLALVAFVAIFFLRVPFPAIVGGAALIGFLGRKWFPPAAAGTSTRPDPGEATGGPEVRHPARRAFRILGCGLIIWLTPILLAGYALGWEHAVFQEGVFFSKASLVTFGGAYAVLPYVAQQAVEVHGWMAPGEMMDGLALAETTPGPLVIVLQFVGFVGAWHQPGDLPPLLSATLGATITVWATFVPCFIWILLGAPHVERLRQVKVLSAALSAVTAAVVGVILNLGVWFGINVLFPPDAAINTFGIVVALVALVGIVRFKWDIIPVILGAAGVGLVRGLVG